MKAIRTLIAKRAPARAPRVIHLPDASAAASASVSRPVRKRLLVLLAAMTVPAMAAPGDFGELPGDAPTEAALVRERLEAQVAANPPMDFERPGRSFPGSAFFFLADPEPSETLIALPTTDAVETGAEAGHELGELIDSGPAATPFSGAAGLAHLRAQECLAQAVWYEAASESEAGQRAVAQVVLNRVAHPSWPGSVCGVVYQGSQRSTGCQFTFTCDGSLARRAGGASWARARRIADEALAGSVYAPVGHATHYHTLWVDPYWASSLTHVGTIGAHRFYRNRGSAGEKNAFTSRYAGFEPTVSGRTTPSPATNATDFALPALPPVASGSSATSPRPAGAASRASSASSASAPVPGPILADPAYAGVGQVREDYARAGQWKSDAARSALEREERSLAAQGASENTRATPPSQ